MRFNTSFSRSDPSLPLLPSFAIDLESPLSSSPISSSRSSRRLFRRSPSSLFYRLPLSRSMAPYLSSSRLHSSPLPLALFLFLFLSLLYLTFFRFTPFTSSSHNASFLYLSPYSLSPSPFPYSTLRNLVLVAGHSVFISTTCQKADLEDSWWLEHYQRVAGQAGTFVDHIRTGVQLAAADPTALLLFSGGQTRKAAGPRTEGQSYWHVAERATWFDHPEVMERSLTEENARDSYENVLFSICRFRELTGNYPTNITVVSYDFKERRFSDLHRSALGFPKNRFFFEGTPGVPSVREKAEAGEAKTREMFEHDPYGCTGALHEKRQKRDPFARTLPYPQGCPELRPLFEYCGRQLYTGSLPWR